MILKAKRRSRLVWIAGVLVVGLLVAQGQALAQDAAAPAGNDRVAKRYARQPKADAATTNCCTDMPLQNPSILKA